MEVMKNIGFVLLGILLAVGITCLVVLIGSAVNGLTFSQQIVEWASNTPEVVEEVVEQTSNTMKFLM